MVLRLRNGNHCNQKNPSFTFRIPATKLQEVKSFFNEKVSQCMSIQFKIADCKCWKTLYNKCSKFNWRGFNILILNWLAALNSIDVLFIFHQIIYCVHEIRTPYFNWNCINTAMHVVLHYFHGFCVYLSNIIFVFIDFSKYCLSNLIS